MREPTIGRFKVEAVGSPFTPAAQIVTSAGMRSPSLISIVRELIWRTAVFVFTTTPSF